jgi:hypothetical protein
MALHVTLTGLRGLVAPPVTIGVYHLLEWFQRGWGVAALLLPFALVLTGARRFERMRRARQAAVAA